MVENILASASDNLKLRSAHIDDMATYFEWVNDTDVRQQSFSSDPVLWEIHLKWFQHKLQQQSCMMLIMEANKVPVGQIRFDFKDGIARIDYSLDKKVRGRHWGEILVKKGIYSVSADNDITFQAEVKRQNIASARIFLKLGFDEMDNSNSEVRLFQMRSIRQDNINHTGKS